VDNVQVKLSEMKLRACAAVWQLLVGMRVVATVGVASILGGVSWGQVLELLVVNRLIDPGSESRVHRQCLEGTP
jgi:hypothetical protein